jgi:hypothetical protein
MKALVIIQATSNRTTAAPDLSEKHRAQDLDQSKQANEKYHQTSDENDTPRSLVAIFIGLRVKESRALVGLLDPTS